MELKGVFPAMATPLTPDEKVDKASVRKLVRYLLEGGVYGLVLMGSTGEFPALDEGMRRDLVDTALDEAKGKVPILIGCGEPGTQRTIVQVRAAARTGADCVLVALPYYFPLDQAAVLRHYLKVAEASTVPVCMYNFPQMTKITIAPETAAKLAAHPNVIGIKDSSSDFFAMQRLLEATAGENFAVVSGSPALGLSAYELGVRGGIFAGASLFPRQCVAVYEAFLRGDTATAVALQKKASLIPLMGGFGPTAAVVKFGLSQLGLCGPTVTSPLALASGQEEKILSWMRQVGLEL